MFNHFPSIFHRFSIIFQSFPRSPTTARGTSAAPRLPWSAPHGRCADGPRLCWSTSGPSRSSSSGDRRPMRFIFGGDEKIRVCCFCFVVMYCKLSSVIDYQNYEICMCVCMYVCTQFPVEKSKFHRLTVGFMVDCMTAAWGKRTIL